MRIAARVVLAILVVVATCPFSACTAPVNPYSNKTAATLGTTSSGYGSAYSSSSGYSSRVPAKSTSLASSSSAGPRATPGASDTEQANELTNYFQHHRLPLVGAKITRDSTGSRQVVLYGFTATAFGKSDAANKAHQFLNDPEAKIDNRIMVRPELANAAPSTPSSTAAAGTSARNESGNLPPGAQAYKNQGEQQNQIAQYQQQNGSSMSALVPLIGLAALAAALLGSGGGFGGGSYPGFSTYPSYPPYGSGGGYYYNGGFP